MKNMKKLNIVILILIVLASFAHAVNDDQVVVLNSKNWREMYLGTIYAGTIGADIVYFDNLETARQKTETLPKWNKIIILESSEKPVLKSYSNFLDKKGITNYKVITFKNFNELQKELFIDQNFERYALLSSKFGVEAMVLSPYLIKNNIAPLFLDNSNVKKIKSAIKNKEYILASNFPIRIKNKFKDASKSFDGNYGENTKEISIFVANDINSEWGVLAKPDVFDLSAFLQTNPLFLYLGDTKETAETITETNVDHFEVIGNGMADIAKNIEVDSGKDLKLIVRYGQTITNLPGMEGKILDIDSIYFDFPFPEVKLEKAEYFENSGILALTYKNTGNINVKIYSNIEFGNNIYSDKENRIIPVGKEITIPFVVDPSDDKFINLDAQYDYQEPLRFNLLSDKGLQIIKKDIVTKTSSAVIPVIIGDVNYDDDNGIMYINIKNPSNEDYMVRSDLILKNNLIETSKAVKIPANSNLDLLIETPYNTFNDFRSYNTKVRVYYGVEDTLFELEQEVKVNKKSNYILIVSITSIILIILLLIIIVIKKRKRKN